MIWYIRWIDIDPNRINDRGGCTGVMGEMLCTFNESGSFITSCNHGHARPEQYAICSIANHTNDISTTYNDINITKHVHNFMNSWSRPSLKTVNHIAHHVYPGDDAINKINFGHKFRLEISKLQPTCLSLSKMVTTLDTPYRFET